MGSRGKCGTVVGVVRTGFCDTTCSHHLKSVRDYLHCVWVYDLCCCHHCIPAMFIMQISTEECLLVFEQYLKTNHSYVQCQWNFCKRFGKQASMKEVTKKLVKFFVTGSVVDRKRNRWKSVLKLKAVCDIEEPIQRLPNKSLRKLSQQQNISLGLAHTVVKKMLKFYPY